MNYNEKNDKLIKNISKYSDQIGGFAGKYKNLVSSCDGVGTKIILAQTAKTAFGRSLWSIGVDCVAMVVNDLLCKGATPLFFLDYFASADINEKDFNEILEGIYYGCQQSGIELLGGETAELPGIIEKGTFDVCGFGVGKITDELPKSNLMQAGDKILGLTSSGFHSNGYTLIRKHLKNLNEEFLSDLLKPTIIYKNDIDKLKNNGFKIKGLAHITGGGFDNVNRILPDNLYADIKLKEYKYFKHDKLFKWIQKEAQLTKKEMMKTFNCGIGMVVIMHPYGNYLRHIIKDHLILGELKEKI